MNLLSSRLIVSLLGMLVLGCLASPANADIYKLELRAWIPFDRIWDPFEDMGYDACDEHHDNWRKYRNCKSYGDGNGHEGFEGSYKVEAQAVFNWNGATISNVQSSQDYDDCSYRIHVLYDWAGNVHPDSDSHRRCQTQYAGAMRHPNSDSAIFMTIDSANPFVPGSPAINAVATVGFSGGMARVTGITDLFPTYGIAVSWLNENGAWVKLDSCILRDASGMNPDNPAAIAAALSSPVNADGCDLNITPPPPPPEPEPEPEPDDPVFCSGSYCIE